MSEPSAASNNAKQAFEAGQDFHEAALRCQRPSDGDEDLRFLLSPEIVCMAFAAEMYLKALILRRVDRQGGHNLQRLFEHGLNDEERELVRAEFARQEYAAPDAFDGLLQHIAGAFTNWRYLYERGEQGIDHSALGAFARAVYHAVRSVEPTWEVPEQRHTILSRNYKGQGHMSFRVGEDGKWPAMLLDALWSMGVQLPTFEAVQGRFWGRTVVRSQMRPKDPHNRT